MTTFLLKGGHVIRGFEYHIVATRFSFVGLGGLKGLDRSLLSAVIAHPTVHQVLAIMIGSPEHPRPLGYGHQSSARVNSRLIRLFN